MNKAPVTRPRLGRRSRKTRLRAKRVYVIGQQQQNAAAQKRLQHAAKTRQKHIVGAVLIALGFVVAAAHIVEHLDYLRLMSPGWQDLLIGYPTAGLLILAGFVLVGQ